MSLGILARCDTGGLAALTREVHRHLHPTRTLLIDVPQAARGECNVSDYVDGSIYQTEWKGGLSADAIDWITAEGIDVLWTAEFWYDERDTPVGLLRQAHGRGIRTVCYAMPELSPWAIPADPTPRSRALHVPTWWRLDTLPNAQLLPFPIARDRLPFRERTEARHLFHQAGTTFHDRSGTRLLLDALPHIITDGLTLTIRDTGRGDQSGTRLQIPASRVEVLVDPSRSVDYWTGYPETIDLLVAPRRYGGLSLPVQECASLGVPALTLDSDPYAVEPFVSTIPSTGSSSERMKGGFVPVHKADPRDLAAAIDFLAQHPAVHQSASRAADQWAVEHDWAGPLGDRWAHMLGADR